MSENGVMAFGFDVTAALNPPGQENVLAARIDNVMTFEKFKAEAVQAFERLPPLSDVLAAFTMRRG